MKTISKNLILREIPLFTNLSQAELNIIKENSAIIEYKKAEVIYKEGSSTSGFYCLISGRVVIYTQDAKGEKSVLEYLHHGKYFGIISLLTDEPHSVTAQAFNDCSLLLIKKDSFDFILKKIPRLAIDLSRTLSRRLKRKDIHQKTIFESTIISLFSYYSHSGKTLYAFNLSLSLKEQTQKSVIILDICPAAKLHSMPAKLETAQPVIFDASTSLSINPERSQGIELSGSPSATPQLLKDFILKSGFGVDLLCLNYKPQDESYLKNLLRVLSLLVNDYHYLILELPSTMDPAIFNILNQSDLVHLLISPEPVDLKRSNNLIQRLKEEFNFSEDKVKVIINEYGLSKLTHQEQLRLLKHSIFATLPKADFEATERLVLDKPDCEYSRAVRRIARETGECQVGLVFGVGVGYGFCHIGVLKVFEEEKIPIDVLAGSSVGAVVASLWAIGFSSAEILEIISSEFKEPRHIWNLLDFTIPHLGFIKGRRLQRFLKKYLGNKTFYDLKLPLKIIASDVKRKEARVLDKGLLLDAVMASCTMPGVFAPFRLKEAMLFDGGVTNPLPTEALLKMGIKKIIAVNVTPSRQDIMRQYEKIKEEITVTLPQKIKRRRLSLDLKGFFKNRFRTNILDIIFSSVEILQSEVAEKEALLADVVLHPDTSGLYWLELHRAAEFVKRGEEEARRNLDKIRRVVSE
ncbi:MAG: patatin-like phospholipase family protein [Candidatus Omnitrophica bacterium]|nr:patatin-like phospholipase family protein [Candidatus Omnitrophota bacterium]